MKKKTAKTIRKSLPPKTPKPYGNILRKNGSVQAYLRYSEKAEKIEEFVPLNSPS